MQKSIHTLSDPFEIYEKRFFYLYAKRSIGQSIYKDIYLIGIGKNISVKKKRKKLRK